MSKSQPDVVEREKFLERSEILADVIKAEEQVDSGKGLDHVEAQKRLLARLKMGGKSCQQLFT